MFNCNPATFIASRQPIIHDIETHDDVRLCCYEFPSKNPKYCFIFYHGGGAHSRAGYMRMADELALNYDTNVYLFDIRGHGGSGGPRGHASSIDSVWLDINTAIEFVRSKNTNLPILLGGHSSGAGLLLNYSLWQYRKKVDGYVLIAPEIGGQNCCKNQHKKEGFINVDPDYIDFRTDKKSVIKGDKEVVHFNYPSLYIEKFGLLKSYTVNMSMALIPKLPLVALHKINVATLFCLSEGDELINTKVLEDLIKPISAENKHINFQIVKMGGHLQLLKSIHHCIGDFFKKGFIKSDYCEHV